MNDLHQLHHNRLKYVATFLKEWRNSQGLTQYALSERTHLHRNSLQRIENGGNMTLLSLFEIADALDINLSEIFIDMKQD